MMGMSFMLRIYLFVFVYLKYLGLTFAQGSVPKGACDTTLSNDMIKETHGNDIKCPLNWKISDQL